MKKSIIFVLFFILSILPLASAVQIDMKSNFSKGETLTAQVSGNFMENIQQQNIFLYEGHVRISFIPVVQKIGDKFYLYGQLSGKPAGNYSIVISGVDYTQSGEITDADITKNFTIGGSMADFSITPGFLEATGNFSINAQNLADNAITISSFFKNATQTESSGFLSSLFGGTMTSEKTSTQISPGQTKSIFFEVDDSYDNQLVYAILETGNTSYEVPVFVSINEIQENNQSALEFQPDERQVSLSTDSSTFIYLYLHNTGPQNLTNVSLSVSDSIKSYIFLFNETADINSDSSVQIKANISSGHDENVTEGQITAMHGNLTANFTLELNFSKSYIPSNETSLFQTCAELGGKFCSGNQTCSLPAENAEDGPCCTGSCQAVADNTSGKIFGWTLAAIIILLVIVFFVWRYIKAKRPFNLLDFARKK